MTKTQVVEAGGYQYQAGIPVDTFARMLATKKHREHGWTMCADCRTGKHACSKLTCTCICNEKDFPWPPKA